MRILTPLLAVSVITLDGGSGFASDTASSPSSTTSSGTSTSSDTQSGQIGYGNTKLKGQKDLSGTSSSASSSDQSNQAGTMGDTVTADAGTTYGGDTTYSGEMGGNQAGMADTTAGTTTAQTSEVTKGYLRSEGVSIKPQLGVIGYRDNTLTDTARAAGGFGLDWNASKLFAMDPSIYVGPSTGFIYSHLGSATSNLFGKGADFVENQAGANMLIIPANLKVGYNINDYYRVSAHGGGNVVYRSIASSMQLGSDFNQSGSLWKLYPNAGIDFEAALGPNVSLALRPDVTFTTTDNFFTGMVALGINLA